VYFADVRLAQEKHTDTGLADASSDGIGKLPVKYGFLERKIPAVFAAGFLKLDLQSLLVHTDTHGGKLGGNIQYRIVYKDVAVQLPVVIVRGASVVALCVAQDLAYLHKEDCVFLLDDLIFPNLGSTVRIHVHKLLGGDESDLSGKDLLDIIVLYGHIFLCLAQDAVDGAYRADERRHGAFFSGDDLLPVPLIHIYGMDVVQILVSPDGDHVCIQSLALGKTVFLQRVALPLGKRVNDLRILLLALDIEAYRAFHAVKIIVKSGRRGYKYRSRDTEKIQFLRQCLLKKIFDCLNCHLGIVKVQVGVIPFGNSHLFHNKS